MAPIRNKNMHIGLRRRGDLYHRGEYYVPPGNVELYTWRRRTFTFFQGSMRYHVDFRRVAASGFFYLGYKDRVKCFKCGLIVSNWTQADYLKSILSHKDTCETRQSLLEYDLVSDYNSREGKQNSQSTSRHQSSTHNTSAASAPPSTISDSDQLSIRSTGSSKSSRDRIPIVSHENLIVLDFFPSLGREVDENDIARAEFEHAQTCEREVPPEPPDPSQARQEELQRKFPCLYPVIPSMRSEASRLETFNRWPSHVKATPIQISSAGFFYLGEGDSVRCYYCSVVLKHWKFDDDPCTEHAKSSPKCELLLQQKGPEFVNHVLQSVPNHVRAQNGSDQPCTSGVAPKPSVIETPSVSDHPASDSQSSPEPNTDCEDDSQQHTMTEKVDDAMESIVVAEALKLGVPNRKIRRAVHRKLKKRGSNFECLEDILDEISWDNESTSENDSDTTDAMAPSAATSSRLTLTLKMFRDEFGILKKATKKDWRQLCQLDTIPAFVDFLCKRFGRHPQFRNRNYNHQKLQTRFFGNLHMARSKFWHYITGNAHIPTSPITQAGFCLGAFHWIFLPEVEFWNFLHGTAQYPHLFTTLCCMLSPINRPSLNTLSRSQSLFGAQQQLDPHDYFETRFRWVVQFIESMATGDLAASHFYRQCDLLLNSNNRAFLPCPCQWCRFFVNF